MKKIKTPKTKTKNAPGIQFIFTYVQLQSRGSVFFSIIPKYTNDVEGMSQKYLDPLIVKLKYKMPSLQDPNNSRCFSGLLEWFSLWSLTLSLPTSPNDTLYNISHIHYEYILQIINVYQIPT